MYVELETLSIKHIVLISYLFVQINDLTKPIILVIFLLYAEIKHSVIA